MRTVSIELFYCYAHEDKKLREELDQHLSGLKRSGIVSSWYDGEIIPGAVWEKAIADRLNRADLVLLLISASFLGSDCCYSTEMERALARHKAGEARVIPILLRPADWEGSPFSELQMLPSGARPITRWVDQDEAFEDVAKGIRRAVEEISAHHETHPAANEQISSSVIKADPVTASDSIRFTLRRFIVLSYTGAIFRLAISPDSNVLVVGSNKGVRIWKLSGGGPSILEGYLHSVTAVAISPDGKTIVGGCLDEKIRMWNFHTGGLLRILERPSDSPKSMRSRMAKLWRTKFYFDVKISPDGLTIVGSCVDKKIRVWNFYTGELVRTLEGQAKAIYAIAISPDGKTIIGGCQDGKIRVWNFHTGELVRTLEGQAKAIYAIAISPDGKTIISGNLRYTGEDYKEIRVWNFHTGELLRKDLADGLTWNPYTYKIFQTLTGHERFITCLDISSDGHIFDTYKIFQTLTGHERFITCLDISSDGQILVSGNSSGSIPRYGAGKEHCNCMIGIWDRL